MKWKAVGIMVLAIGALTACNRVDPNSPLGKRKAIYQQMLDVKEDLGGMLRGRLEFKAEPFVQGAARLEALSQQPWQHYPAQKEVQSAARDEVWQRQERFNELARTLEANTAALARAATEQVPTPQSMAQPFQRVEDTCEACHKEFRSY